MIVKDLLFQCSVDDIVDEWVKKWYEDVNIEKLYDALDRLIAELKLRQPVDSNYVILGIERVRDNKKFIYADMFEINEVINGLRTYSELEKLADGTGISAPKVKEFIESVRLPDSYGYEFTEWNEILGCKIDEQNAKKCGMVKLLADILFEMTFFGFDERDVERKREELDQAIREFEEIENLPTEEQDKCFHSTEEVMEELGIEHESHEENVEAKEEMYQEMLYNIQQIYCVLCEFKERMIRSKK